MVQLGSDNLRRQTLMNASQSAKREGREFYQSPLQERLKEMREKSERKKRKKKGGLRFWIILLCLGFAVPLFSGGGNNYSSINIDDMINAQMTPVTDAKANEEALMNALPSLNQSLLNEKATVTITYGGQTISQDISIDDIRRLQTGQDDINLPLSD